MNEYSKTVIRYIRMQKTVKTLCKFQNAELAAKRGTYKMRSAKLTMYKLRNENAKLNICTKTTTKKRKFTVYNE